MSPGEALYQLYTEAHLRRYCEVDKWHELPQEDRDVWEEIARETLVAGWHGG